MISKSDSNNSEDPTAAAYEDSKAKIDTQSNDLPINSLKTAINAFLIHLIDGFSNFFHF